MPRKRITRACEFCGAIFHPLAKEVKRGDGRFCSPACSYASRTSPIEDRFWPKVRKTDGCWLWTGSRLHGYGQIGSGGHTGRPLPAHRVSWEMHYGPIPPGLEVCHHCDNPPCVRPDHLFLGTTADNMADKVQKGRQAHGPRHYATRVSIEQVERVRALAASGMRQADIARELGLRPQFVHKVVHRLRRRNG